MDDGGGGMVAVVRALQNSALAVTLVDAGKQFSLVPNSALIDNIGSSIQHAGSHMQHTGSCIPHVGSRDQSCATAAVSTDPVRYTSGSQATCEQYTSVYKMAHCHVTPTSSPVATEFPPQKSEVCPGHGNFEVGGAGSGKTYYCPVKASSYRGGMSWPDRGSVCIPRESHSPDKFASSLRKYPQPPMGYVDRSSEVFERILSYGNPPRSKAGSRGNSRLSSLTPNSFEYEREMSPTRPAQCPTRLDHYPNRGRSEVNKRSIDRNYDIRRMREERVLKNGREKINSPTTNTETPAEVNMVPRESTKTPISTLLQRNIAVPQTPKTSTCNITEDGVFVLQQPNTSFSKSQNLSKAQKHTLYLDNHHTTSSVDINKNSRNIETLRLSKSEEKIKLSELEVGTQLIRGWLNEFSNDQNPKPEAKAFLKKLYTKLQRLSELNKNGCIFKDDIFQNCESGERKNSIYKSTTNTVNRDSKVYRAEITLDKMPPLEALLKSIIREIPTNLGDKINIEQILDEVVTNIKKLLESENCDKSILKSKIKSILEHVPFEISDKDSFLNNLSMFIIDSFGKRVRPKSDKNASNKDKILKTKGTCMLATKDKLIELVQNNLRSFLDKTKLIVSTCRMKELEISISEILLNCFDEFMKGDFDIIKEDICEVFQCIGKFSKYQGVYFASKLIDHLQNSYDFVSDSINTKIHSSKKFGDIRCEHLYVKNSYSSEFSTGQQSNHDSCADEEQFINKILSEINKWLNSFGGEISKIIIFKSQSRDLAVKIVERKKYLQLHPSYKTTPEEELEHLKYQIFTWMSKIVTERKIKLLEYASELQKAIQNLPAPSVNITGCQKNFAHSNKCNNNKTEAFGVLEDVMKSAMFNYPPTSTFNNFKISRQICPVSVQNESLPSNENMSAEKFNSRQNHTEVISSKKYIENANRRKSDPGRRSFNNENIQKDNKKSNQFQFIPNNESSKSKGAELSNPVDDNTENKNTYQKEFITNYESSKSKGAELSKAVGGNTENKYQKEFSHRIIQTESKIEINESGIENKRCKSAPGRVITKNSSGTNVHMTTDKINEQYDQFLKEWVKNIPISAYTPEEQSYSDKLRLGIYNGVWKIITQITSDNNAKLLNNKVACSDLLDNEIEELLGLLPQTPELKAQKDKLKRKLIIETADAIEKMIRSNKTYKQALNEYIANPKRTELHRDEDPLLVMEEIQIIKIVENFLLALRYKEDDIVVANIYRKKLIKSIQGYIHMIKENHSGDAFQFIDPELYQNVIIEMLHEVPKPSDETIKKEADKILLGAEVDRWVSELPIDRNWIKNPDDQLIFKRLKDNLVNKIHSMKSQQKEQSSFNKNLEHEISLFLEKMPLEANKDLNINEMVNVLIERINNESLLNDTRQEHLTSHRLQTYEEFVPPLSSTAQENSPNNYCKARRGSRCNDICNMKYSLQHKSFSVQRSPCSTFYDNDTKFYTLDNQHPQSYRQLVDRSQRNTSERSLGGNLELFAQDLSSQNIGNQTTPPFYQGTHYDNSHNKTNRRQDAKLLQPNNQRPSSTEMQGGNLILTPNFERSNRSSNRPEQMIGTNIVGPSSQPSGLYFPSPSDNNTSVAHKVVQPHLQLNPENINGNWSNPAKLKTNTEQGGGSNTTYVQFEPFSAYRPDRQLASTNRKDAPQRRNSAGVGQHERREYGSRQSTPIRNCPYYAEYQGLDTYETDFESEREEAKMRCRCTDRVCKCRKRPIIVCDDCKMGRVHCLMKFPSRPYYY